MIGENSRMNSSEQDERSEKSELKSLNCQSNCQSMVNVSDSNIDITFKLTYQIQDV